MQDDMIPRHRHIDVDSVGDAIGVLQEHGRDARVISGNTELADWMKNRIKTPRVVVDLKNIDELHGINTRDDGGLRIGAMATVNEVVKSDLVRENFGLLSEAASAVATPQIRNQGRIGGNLAQDSWCRYYREGFDCYRAGGNTCYAVTDDSREHSVTDYNRCITANPSDTAPAFIALGSEVVIEGPRGERRQPLSEFFVGPETNITVMNDLSHDEILKEIIVPGTWAGADFYFEKVRDRNQWDFALVNIAAAVQRSGRSVSDVRLVSNGIAPKPKRLRAAENAVRGNSLSESRIDSAAEAILPNVEPFADNEYKVPLTRNLVRRALANAS